MEQKSFLFFVYSILGMANNAFRVESSRRVEHKRQREAFLWYKYLIGTLYEYCEKTMPELDMREISIGTNKQIRMINLCRIIIKLLEIFLIKKT